MREKAFLPSGQEYGVKFETLCGMQGHDVDLVVALGIVGIHDQRHVLKKPAMFSNSPMERTSSLRFSRRPLASADLSFCHISV